MACADVSETPTEAKEWKVQSYLEQHLRIWPQYGNHILAQYDESTIVVYQAFCHEIADYAIRYQKYASAYSYLPTRLTGVFFRVVGLEAIISPSLVCRGSNPTSCG